MIKLSNGPSIKFNERNEFEWTIVKQKARYLD